MTGNNIIWDEKKCKISGLWNKEDILSLHWPHTLWQFLPPALTQGAYLINNKYNVISRKQEAELSHKIIEIRKFKNIYKFWQNDDILTPHGPHIRECGKKNNGWRATGAVSEFSIPSQILSDGRWTEHVGKKLLRQRVIGKRYIEYEDHRKRPKIHWFYGY